MILEVKNIAKVYGEESATTMALRGVSFFVEPGEFVAIMGPSGSGKSTLLHILGFLDRQSSGKYFFHGKTIEDYSEEEVAKIRNKEMGFIFQAFNLMPRTTVLDNVKLPLMYSKIPEREWNTRAQSALESVGLLERSGHTPSQLSGGEKQRTAIARALVTHPKIIFADEPTGNLDTKSGTAVLEMLKRLNSDKKHTIVLITHDAKAAEYAQRIITLKDGEIESDRQQKNL